MRRLPALRRLSVGLAVLALAIPAAAWAHASLKTEFPVSSRS